MQSRWQRLLLVVLVLVGAAMGVAKQAMAQVITEFPVPTANSYPRGIVTGPDGALWFTEPNTNKIGRITTSGAITEFPVGGIGQYYGWIAAGPDGALWFTESAANKIGRITTTGVLSEFPIPTANSAPTGITLGSDGNLWFTEVSANKIGRITTAGVITEFPIPTGGSGAWLITAGPDGALWFDEFYTNKIGRITTAGVVTEFTVPTSNSGPSGITAGPDGALWFCEQYADKIGRITTAGVFTEFPIPTSGANSEGITVGPDGALWFAEAVSNGKIGRITLAGVVTEFKLPAAGGLPFGVVTGPDDALWFTDYANNIGRVSVPLLQVSPTSNIAASGPQGGPFSPASFQYQLSASTGSVDFSISNIPSWLTASVSSGTATTAPQTVTFTVNATANTLTPGTYGPTTITFTNSDSGRNTTTVTATLTVVPVPLPTVTSIAPTSGTTLGGTSVTITGTNLTGATAVTIGGTAATGVTVVNASTVTAVTPAHVTGVVDVVVTTPGGTGTGSGLYTYVTPAPTVTSIAPTSGTTLGGTSVTITGTNLTGATAVKFGGTNAASFNVNSATSITASSPAGSGIVDVTVTTAGGTSATSAFDQFTYIPALQVAPTSNIVTAANQGEPFFPSSFQYQLSTTAGSINYSIMGVPLWLTASATSGTATTAATTVTFTVNASANNLAVGTYGPFTITFVNSATSQASATVTATLTVNAALATTTTCVKTSKVCPNLWWFNNVSPQPTNYVTTIQAPSGGTDYTWTITEGTQYAQFNNHSSTIDTKTKNSVEILPNGDPGDGSAPIVAVTVKVVSRTGTKTANPFVLHLRKPYELQPNGIVDKTDSTYGYQSQIHYRILDQTGAVLPFPIALNENFTSGVVNDYPDTNWTLPAACGTTHVCSGTYNPSDWYYLVQGAKRGSIPASQPPHSPLGTTMVDHWTGTWGIGSGTPGAGVTVQTNTWQRFQDHARHTNIVSPPP